MFILKCTCSTALSNRIIIERLWKEFDLKFFFLKILFDFQALKKYCYVALFFNYNYLFLIIFCQIMKLREMMEGREGEREKMDNLWER